MLEPRLTSVSGATSILRAIRLLSVDGRETDGVRAACDGAWRRCEDSGVLLGQGRAGLGRSTHAESSGLSQTQ